MVDGIYTLANDVVYEQLVALLNSIEANAGREIPVCVFAYNDNLDKVRAEIARRSNVTLFEDADVFAEWEAFSLRVWQTHPTALAQWKQQGVTSQVARLTSNRRYCAFDPAAPFDRFVYMDADTLLMQPLNFIFHKLTEVDVVVYDFQHKDPGHIYTIHSPRLHQVFSPEQIEANIFCAGFYGSNRGLLDRDQREQIIQSLQAGDADVLYMGAPNQSVLNYMVMTAELSVYNFARALAPTTRAGNSVTSAHFQERDHILYDGDTRLTFLHYIGLSSRYFDQVCQGENISFPYRDLFLHYRYRHNPQQRPKFVGKPRPYNQVPNLFQRAIKKLNLSG